MTPEFHPAAEMELAAPVKIGETRSLGLGRDLEEEVRRVTELLCDMPQLGQPVDSRHRKFPLNRFPFGLIFRVDGELLRIIAIAHRRQRPGYWTARA